MTRFSIRQLQGQSRKLPARKRDAANLTSCRRCHYRKVAKPVECVYPRKNHLIKVSEQYLEDLVAENQRLRGSAQLPGEDTTNAPACLNPVMAISPESTFPVTSNFLLGRSLKCPWPTPARARRLVQAALNGLGRCYHIVRRSSTLQELHNVSLSALSKSKLWALFAIGEMYTTRNPSPDKDFLGIRERPSVDMAEIQLLLPVYSLLAGSAVRLAIIMGLHLNSPESQLSVCHQTRQVWVIRRLLDFPVPPYFVARIGLSRISGRIIYSIYGKKSQGTALSHRVQVVFEDLRRWLEDLPPTLQSPTRSKNIDVPASATALSETCIRCARHLCCLSIDSWTNGSFMVLDFFYAQYIFSAAIVLTISTLLHGKDRQSDEEQFEVAHIEAITDLPRSTKMRLGVQHDTGTAHFDPPLQELLERPPPDLEFIDSSLCLDEQQGFYWPMRVPRALPHEELQRTRVGSSKRSR
ncbi:hypothetical protein BDW71DRAFT_197453 [Aspergillus fruticulosus]